MIFCVSQLVEKASEHNTELCMLFVDLKKSYDSIPRQEMWIVLEKYDVPPEMVNNIRLLHEGMKAEVTIDAQTAPEFEIRNGLQQGCTISTWWSHAGKTGAIPWGLIFCTSIMGSL